VNKTQKFIVTSALPYAEAVPHLGNFVGSILPADVYFKYLKMKGEDAIFICGSDQHGTPIELKAIKAGITPDQLSNEVHEKIKKVMERSGCTFTYYGKTHSESNKLTVYEIFESLRKNGYIVETEDTQAYCSVDDRFLSDRFIIGTCPYCGYHDARGDQCENCGHLLNPQELIEPYCAVCGNKKLEFRKTKNLALDLEALSGEIKAFVESHKRNNWTKNAINKTLSYLEQGLKPRDITRNIKWGFPVPLKGFEDKAFYVWFDAVIGYIGITREWSESQYLNYWKDPEAKLIQFMGKDNLEFHTMMWPGILIGAGREYVLPHTIKVFEYLNAKGVKFSKSKGVGLNMEGAVELLPSDYWRFALMYLLPETSDTDFSIEEFIEIVNKVMNDKIGNLVNRVLTIYGANRGMISGSEAEAASISKAKSIISEYIAEFDAINMRNALHKVIGLSELGNEVMSSTEPWKLAKAEDANSKKEFSKIMVSLRQIVYDLGIMLWPFAPDAASKILDYFGVDAQPKIKMLENVPDIDTGKPPKAIFSKITEKERKKFEKYIDS